MRETKNPFVNDRKDLGDLLDRHDEVFNQFGKTVSKGVKVGIVAWAIGALFSVVLTLGILGFLAFVILKVMAHYGIL